MKKLKLSGLLFSLLLLKANAQETAKQVFESPNMKEAIAKHKTVAILPIKTTITYKRPPKNYDESSNKSEEESMATNLQTGMYTYLLRKAKNYSVTFQDVERTNALLKQAGVYNNVDAILSDSLAKILKVDAIIKCSYSYEKTASEAGAIVKTVLFGGIGSKTASGALTMQVNDGQSGDLLWRFYKSMNENFIGNATEVMERMMRKVSRNFPYEN
ncbi:MAG: hypothetical protein KGZ59_09885 [Chitinophagaceae bacterium]|nr:hypothetical protein [Chitinophagaceae bacterium]